MSNQTKRLKEADVHGVAAWARDELLELSRRQDKIEAEVRMLKLAVERKEGKAIR